MDNNRYFLTQALGTSIWKEIHHYFPMKTIYLADSKNALWPKSKEIVALSIKKLICYLK
jgi:hypothetical protein